MVWPPTPGPSAAAAAVASAPSTRRKWTASAASVAGHPFVPTKYVEWIKACASTPVARRPVFLEKSLKLWAEKGYHGTDVAELQAQLPELRQKLSQCQEDLEQVMKPLEFKPDDGTKLERSALEVLDQVARVLQKHPRVPIMVDVCADASQPEEEKLSQAAAVKRELSSRISNEIRVFSGSKPGPLNVRIRLGEGKDVKDHQRVANVPGPKEVLMPKAPKSAPKPRKRGPKE